MNREILFRGKRCSGGKWVYGFYVESKHSWQGHKPHKSWIIPNAISNGGFFNVLGRYAVKDDTVGQFTGLVDKKGNKIYDGDILFVEFADKSGGYQLVGWNKKTASWGIMDAYSYQSIKEGYDFAEFKNYVLLAFLKNAILCEVVGNIHDNSELLAAK